MLRRAIESVQRQTYQAIEIIVIIDGPDDVTRQLLKATDDKRLKVLQNATSEGPGRARNRGALEASGDWIAFLDDDDEWLPEKLARQLAGHTPSRDVILSCRCRVETPSGTYIWPHRLCGPRENVDDYLYDRRSLARGDAYIATPSLVLPRRLFAASGFGTTYHNEDTTLLLDLTKRQGAELVMLYDVLVVIHEEQAWGSLGATFDWREMLRWLDDRGTLVTRRAYSGFALVRLGSQAANQGDYVAIPALLSAAVRHGTPRAIHLLLFAAYWVVPKDLRQRWLAFRARPAATSARHRDGRRQSRADAARSR